MSALVKQTRENLQYTSHRDLRLKLRQVRRRLVSSMLLNGGDQQSTVLNCGSLPPVPHPLNLQG